MVDKKEVERVFALSKQDIYFIIIIAMLAVQMGFSFSLIEPVRNLQEAIRNEQVHDRELQEAIRAEQVDQISPQLEELLAMHNFSRNSSR